MSDEAEIAGRLSEGTAYDSLYQAIEAELALYDIADFDCPVRKRGWRGDGICPRCRASASYPCGDDVRGAYAFVRAIRALLEHQNAE